jgi:hypothetical protein
MSEKSKGELVGSGGMMFICWQGIERSAKSALAMRNAGLPATHLEGGTIGMVSMSDKDLKEKLNGHEVFLIYDRNSRLEEFEYKQKASDRLKELGIPFKVIDKQEMTIIMLDNGQDPNDYFY